MSSLRAPFSFSLNKMNCTTGINSIPFPDAESIGLDITEVFEAPTGRFRDHEEPFDYIIKFAGAKRSSVIPNIVLLIEHRRYDGPGLSDQGDTIHWRIVDDFWYGEWRRWYGFPDRTSSNPDSPDIIITSEKKEV